MAHQNHNPEAHKKTTAKESVDSLIDRKHAEKEAEVSAGAAEKMAGTQTEVADVMGGAEKPSEKVSKRVGEKGEGGMPAGGAATGGDETQVIAAQLKNYHFPSEAIMIKKIRIAINTQIKSEWKNALKFQKQLGIGGASNYNQSISKIRQFKQMLTSLFGTTVGYLKNMYVKYFTPDGKRKKTVGA